MDDKQKKPAPKDASYYLKRSMSKPIMDFGSSLSKSIRPDKLEALKKEPTKKANPLLQVMKNPIGSMIGGFIGSGSKVIKNLAENIDPYNYDSYDPSSNAKIDAVSRFIRAGLLGKKEQSRIETEKMAQEGRDNFYDKSNEPKTRIDLLNIWANNPQKYNTLEKSNYRPSIGGDPNKPYLRSKAIESDIVNNMFYTDAAKKILSNGVRSEEDLQRLVNETGLSASGRGKGGVSMTVPGLGQGTIGIGKDNKGLYLSYSDVWDVDPTSGTSATSKSSLAKKGVELLQRTGLVSPPSVYGRIYFDPKTGKPILE